MAKILEFEEFLTKIFVICDVQEKVNYHIINYFRDNYIQFHIRYMAEGDYTFRFDGMPQNCFIERKNSLNELSGNLSSEPKRERFYKEFTRMKEAKKYLLIENDNIDNLISGTYGTGYHENAFMANFILLKERFKIQHYFVNRYNMAFWILKLFYYYYYDKMKK